MFAIQEKKGRYIVVEGNRRLAAVKLLVSSDLRKSVNIKGIPKAPKTARNKLKELPVVIIDREGVWRYVGFKHINGARPWGSYSKAEFIARVYNNHGVPLDKIARQIGNYHSTVKRLYWGLMVINQAEKTNVFDREDRWAKRLFFPICIQG